MKTIKWGILGAGTIANKFAEALLSLDDIELVAVMSRREESVITFGQKFGIEPKYCFTSVKDMLLLDEIDIIYIATPNSSHYEYSMLSLTHNKSVLCENHRC